MKKFSYLLLMLLLPAFILTGCSSDDNNNGQIELPNPAEQTQEAYADNAATGGFTFTARSAWTATVSEATPAGRFAISDPGASVSTPSWLRLLYGGEEKYSGGAGRFTLAIELDYNYSGETRSATITITSGSDKITITVTQEGVTANNEIPVDPYPVTDVRVNESSLSMTVGDKKTLVAAVTPDNATVKTVSWSSSDPSIAAVNTTTGEITALKKGIATITATSAAYPDISAVCNVTVTEKGIPKLITKIVETASLNSDYHNSGNLYEPYSYEFKYDQKDRLKEYIIKENGGNLYNKFVYSYEIQNEIRIVDDYDNTYSLPLNNNGYLKESNDGYSTHTYTYDSEGYLTRITPDESYQRNTYEYTWSNGNPVMMRTIRDEWNEDYETPSKFSSELNDKTTIDLNMFFFGLTRTGYIYNSYYPCDNEEDLCSLIGLTGKRARNYMLTKSYDLNEPEAMALNICSEQRVPDVGSVVRTSYDMDFYGEGKYIFDADGYPTAFTHQVEVEKTLYIYNGVRERVTFENNSWWWGGETEEEFYRFMEKEYGPGPWFTITLDEGEPTTTYDTYTYTISYNR